MYELITTAAGALELKVVGTSVPLWIQPDPKSNSLSPVPNSKLFLNSGTGKAMLYSSDQQRSTWESQLNITNGKAPFKLFLQNDGNLVTKDGKGQVVWSTNIVPPPVKTNECTGGFCSEIMTSNNGIYKLATNSDGILELKDTSTNNILFSQPKSKPMLNNGRILLVKDSGVWMLVVTSDRGWQVAAYTATPTITTGKAPFKLVLQDDGNLVTKDSNGLVVWSSGTAKPPAPIVPPAPIAPPTPSLPPTPIVPPAATKTNECKVGKCSSLLEAGDVKLMLQHDGILMLQSPTAPSKVIAKASDKGLNGPYTLFLGQNGNLMILDKTKDHPNAVWSSNSFLADESQVGTYRAVLTEDGSFTIRNGRGKVIWSADDVIPKPKPAPAPMPAPVPSDSSGSVPDRTDIIPDTQISNTGSMAMALKYKSDLLKDLQKVIRNELLADRMTQRLERDDNEDDDDTDAMAQGREYGCRRKDACHCPKNSDRSCSSDY